jgi:hypothetical protein
MELLEELLVNENKTWSKCSKRIETTSRQKALMVRVLSGEMDLAKNGHIRKVLIKGRSADIFRKFRPHPIL